MSNPVPHKQGKRKPAQSATQLQVFFNHSPDLLCIIQPDGTFGQLNPAWKRLLDWTPEALQSRPWSELVHPEDVEASLSALARAKAASLQQATEDRACYFNNRYRHKDGSYRCLSWSLCPSEDEHWYAIAREVTADKQTDEPLPAEFELDSFFRFSLDLFCIAGMDGYFKRVNPAFEKTLGYTNEEILATPFLDLIHPDDHTATLAELEKLTLGKPTINFENRHRCKNGSYRWLAWTTTPISPQGLLYAVGRDVTEQKQIEAALRESQARYKLIAEGSNDGLWDYDLQTNQVYYSPRWKRALGFEDDEFPNTSDEWFKRVHHEDSNQATEAFQAYVEGLRPVFELEYRILHKDGTYRWMLSRGACLRDANGQPCRLAGSHTDITERKQAESALRENAEMLRLLLKYAPAAIAMLDKDMKYQLVSRRWLKDYNLYNLKSCEPAICYPNVIGKSHYEVFPEVPERWKQIHQRCLQGAVENCEEDVFVRANGKKDWLKWEIHPWTDSEGQISGLIMVSEVITERRKAKERLQRLNEKLLHSNRDLEQFAYVASHDLQEPLRAVNSYAQLLARKYQGHLDAKADKYIEYMVEGATRMQQLINDLLSFSRVGTHGKNLEPTACENVLSQVLANLKVAIAESMTVVTHDALPIVTGDETLLMQLLQNLIANAIKFRREEPPRVHISAVQEENEWNFSVRDNGIGMETEYFERIFTIFQRLHSRSEYPGTGIGLAVCKKIVEHHRGRIWVESTLGVGTTFHFTIPHTRH